MIGIGVPEEEVKFAMRRGVIDLITVIPKDELNKGIAFLRTMIAEFISEYDAVDETLSHQRWDNFFEGYFIA